MHEGAQRFVGTHDFASVRSQGTPVKSTVRTIFWCDVDKVDDLIRIRVCGDGFLYNMVRAIAGTLTMSAAASCGLTTLPTCLRPATESRPDRRCLPAVCL